MGKGVERAVFRLPSQAVVTATVWMCSLVYRSVLWLTSAELISELGSSHLGAVRVGLPLDHRHLPFVLEGAIVAAAPAGEVELILWDLRYDLHSTQIASVVGCEILGFDAVGRPRRPRPPRDGPPRRRRPPRPVPAPDVGELLEGHEGGGGAADG